MLYVEHTAPGNQAPEKHKKSYTVGGGGGWGGGWGTVGQHVCITSQGKKFNFGPKALRKECGNSPYSIHQWIGNGILPHFDPK